LACDGTLTKTGGTFTDHSRRDRRYTAQIAGFGYEIEGAVILKPWFDCTNLRVSINLEA
jgi:hypothetical protein